MKGVIVVEPKHYLHRDRKHQSGYLVVVISKQQICLFGSESEGQAFVKIEQMNYTPQMDSMVT